MTCGGEQTFTCNGPPRKSLKWTISGLHGIDETTPFRPYKYKMDNPEGRITSSDRGANSQTRLSDITILRFNDSDVGGIIQCMNVDDNVIIGMATISMRECVCTMEVLN